MQALQKGMNVVRLDKLGRALGGALTAQPGPT